MRRNSTERQRLWFDKTYKEGYSYSKEELIEIYRKRTALYKGMKRKRKEKEIVINNGVIEKRYNADLPIPEGWERGKVKRGATK